MIPSITSRWLAGEVEAITATTATLTRHEAANLTIRRIIHEIQGLGYQDTETAVALLRNLVEEVAAAEHPPQPTTHQETLTQILTDAGWSPYQSARGDGFTVEPMPGNATATAYAFLVTYHNLYAKIGPCSDHAVRMRKVLAASGVTILGRDHASLSVRVPLTFKGVTAPSPFAARA